MDRKDFLKSCASGLCACTAAALLPASSLSAAETAKSEDWKLPFVQKRYAKLLEILESRMDKEELNEVLVALGTFCSSLSDAWIEKHRGDPEGFCRAFKQGSSGDDVTYDAERGIITMISPERTECFCPLNSKKTPGVVCNCSLGWQTHTWETFFRKKVRVELKEAVLRGGKRCIFEIHLEKSSPA